MALKKKDGSKQTVFIGESNLFCNRVKEVPSNLFDLNYLLNLGDVWWLKLYCCNVFLYVKALKIQIHLTERITEDNIHHTTNPLLCISLLDPLWVRTRWKQCGSLRDRVLWSPFRKDGAILLYEQRAESLPVALLDPLQCLSRGHHLPGQSPASDGHGRDTKG